MNLRPAVPITIVALIGLAAAPWCVAIGSRLAGQSVNPTVGLPIAQENQQQSLATHTSTSSAGWSIHQLGSCVARMTDSSENPTQFTVDFTSYLPGPYWQTQLVGPGASSSSPELPVNALEIRADQPRSIFIWWKSPHGQSPRRSFSLTTDWQRFELPPPSGDRTQLVIAVGDSPIPIHLRPAPSPDR
jgi:hypothetical protein